MKATARIGILVPSVALAVVVFVCPAGQAGQSPVKEQSPSEHRSHLDQVNEHGDHVMGFDHTKTTHHFRLLGDGGAIEVSADDPADSASRDQIRHHLQHIAMMFSAGDFSAPMLIHGQTPAGVEVMKELKEDIAFKFEETALGARLKISTSSPEALRAVHEFLVFQIKEHETGDSLDVEKQ
ncbi:MAG: hypothetical protein ACREDR_01545 [Blastocatellia bacterium]